ncbi:hypothetical protein M3Y97_00552400 [Aphelenchoides bicaudatus]|nr:hypothetical protein M3Y97_00552400 [Aphelenchoides bicaudatus]
MSKKAYLPTNWDTDGEMAGFMSALKIRDVNPQNYDRIVDFWRRMIEEYCHYEKKCLIDYDELKLNFKRGNQLPAPLPKVLEELYNSQIIVPANELPSPRQGWFKWIASKSSWLLGAALDVQKTEFIHLPTLKAQAKELLNFYKIQYENVDCPEVVEYNELKARCVNTICESRCFDYVIDELMRQGECNEFTTETGERLLKFKDQNTKGPAKINHVDVSVHELRRMINKVDGELRRIEQKVNTFEKEARAAVQRKDKTAALHALRKKKRAEKEMQDKDVQYQRLVGMLEQLATSKQSREILDAYKTATAAYKSALERQGLSLDKVDETMDSIHEAIQDANDVDEALREGFGSIPVPSSHVSDADLEAELNSIINEEDKTKKHEPKMPELPSVPTDRVTDTDLANRLRRLRQPVAE